MKKQTGFTLLEMMVMVAIVAILITAGLPKMSIFFKGNRMITNTNDLVAGLQIARSQAIKEGSRVAICKSSDADTAAPSCDTSGTSWETGWIVFVDTSNNGEREADEIIVRSSDGVSGVGVTITADTTDIENFVSFTSRGIPKKINGVSVSGVFRVCDDRGLKNASGNVVARGIEIGASGRVRTSNLESKIVSCP